MTDEPTPNALAVYSDYVCPFCYLGRASLREYLDEATDPPTVEWRFFDLRGYKRTPDGRIDHDVDDGKDDDYFERARENVRQLADRYDVEMDLDVAMDVDSWNAQQAALYVREEYGEDSFTAFHHAVFDALWQDGRDVGDPAVLADVAASVGLPDDEVRDATDDEVLADDLRERFAAAREAGVTGIPTFVYDGYAARGAVPPAHLERLVGDA